VFNETKQRPLYLVEAFAASGVRPQAEAQDRLATRIGVG
jgi:hypothetical protein